MTKPLMLICDDDFRRGDTWAETVRMAGAGRYDIRPLTGRTLAAAVNALTERRQQLRSGRPPLVSPDAASEFDSAALVLLDYDLTPDDETIKASEVGGSPGDMTALRGRSGEGVAYLLRCFTATGYVVLVNQLFKGRTFDVTMQRFARSRADLNISQSDLSNQALWSGESTASDPFHPWHWPVLNDADALWEKRLAATSPTARVMDTLGFTIEDRFSAKQLDLLAEGSVGAMDHAIGDVTFDHLVDSSLGLEVKDRTYLTDPTQRQRIAASVAARWLEQVVLAGQNVLADLPHLVSRFPALLAETALEPGALQATTQKGRSTPGTTSLFDSPAPAVLDTLEPSPAQAFLSRAAWSAASVRALAHNLGEPEEWSSSVFCEDTSRFIDLDQAQEVETDLPGPNNRRFVQRLPDVRYDPLRRVL